MPVTIICTPLTFFGTTLQGAERRPGDEERFISFCQKNPSSGCIEWTGSLSRGYGQLSAYCPRLRKNRPQKAYRWILQNKAGRLLNREEHACHTCDNPKCVNPKHLYVGSALTNSQDMISRSGHYLANDPARSVRSKLTPDEVKKIRARHAAGGISYGQLARDYGMDSSLMSKIVRGLRYKHVK